MKYLVTVTADDILGAEPGDAGNCPVGRAISRVSQKPHLWIAACGKDAAVWESMHGPLLTPLPAPVGEFLWKFDHGDVVEPGLTFVVELP